MTEKSCSTHPDAPHGFDRNSSHSLGRYVCECESWSPDLVKRLRDTAERNGAVMNTSLYSEAADLIEQQAGEIELHKEENKQLREQLHWLLAAKPNVAMVAENQALRAVAAEMAEALEEAMYSNSTEVAIKQSGEALAKWKELNK